MCKIFDAVKSALIDGLGCLITGESTPYADDLHSVLFNSDEYYIYYASAEEAIAELDVWECIGVVQTYEQDQFGGVYTPLANACRVANMIIYIIGYELMQAIYSDTAFFHNEELSTDDLKEMLTLAETWFEENHNGLNNIWLDLPTE